MLFALFFALIVLASLAGIGVADSALRWSLIWPALSGSLLAIAYARNQPTLVMGKGGPAWQRVFMLVNLPWLLPTWFVALLSRLGREHACDRIPNTNIFIGRYPSRREVAEFDFVVDLTAEFPRSFRAAGLSIPNLDGVALADPTPLDLPVDAKLLVHCAQGHGRSSTWLAIQLVHAGVCTDHDAALAAIQRARPRARPSRGQQAQLSGRAAHIESANQIP